MRDKLCSQRVELFKKLYPLIKRNRSLYLALGALQVWTLLLTLISPFLYLLLINRVMMEGQRKLFPLLLVGYVVVYLLQTGTAVVRKITYNHLFFKFRLSTKQKVMHRYTTMYLGVYERYAPGELKNRIEGDIDIVEKFFNTHILDFLYAGVSCLVLAVLLLVLHPLLGLIGLIMVPFSFWFSKFMGKKVHSLNEQQRQYDGKYEGFLYQTAQQWKEIKANNLQDNQDKTLQQYHQTLSGLVLKNQIYWFINRSFISFKDLFITKMNLYFLGGLFIIADQMTVGVLIAFMAYYDQFFSNISVVTDSMVGLKNDTPNMERVLEIFRTFQPSENFFSGERVQLNSAQSALVTPPDRLQEKNLGNSIEVCQVSFQYAPEQPFVLQDVSIAIQPKECVAIVGRSGCGKTTLAKLLVGLYYPTDGEVCLGNHNIQHISRRSLSKKIGMVRQEPILFHSSIRDNLRLAKRYAQDDELIAACKIANIFTDIEKLPDQFDTVVGEQGLKLSGGQRQRLAIARILLQNPDIILFDEATSALDSESEKEIVAAINQISKEKTVIVIAHRLSTILGCDRVIVMEAGTIVGVGTHEMLRQHHGTYQRLFALELSP